MSCSRSRAEKPARDDRRAAEVERTMARSRARYPPGVDPKLLIKDAAKLLPDPSRRLFLRGAASLGALSMLTGCDIIDGPTSENVLRVISRFNDRVQALLFSETTLAPEYPESAITRPFPFNAYYCQGRGARYRRRQLSARDRRPRRQQEAVDAAGTEQAAGSLADHAPCLRRGLERDRLLAGREAFGFPENDRRRHSPPNMSGSNAPRAIRTPSTCRPRCIRRRN